MSLSQSPLPGAFGRTVSLEQAIELRPFLPRHTLVVIGDDPPWLIEEACRRARALGGSAVYCVYVEGPRLPFAGSSRSRTGTARRVLHEAFREARQHGLDLVPIGMVSRNVAEAIAHIADSLDVDAILMRGFERRNLMTRLFGAQWVRRIRRRLAKNRRLVLYS
jgi:nucleotide-binding universal stress UspA family protein